MQSLETNHYKSVTGSQVPDEVNYVFNCEVLKYDEVNKVFKYLFNVEEEHGTSDYNTARRHFGLTQLQSLETNHYKTVTESQVPDDVRHILIEYFCAYLMMR